MVDVYFEGMPEFSIALAAILGVIYVSRGNKKFAGILVYHVFRGDLILRYGLTIASFLLNL